MSGKRRTDQRPWPGEFDDYRDYLRELIAHLKAGKCPFSSRLFARRAGYSSSGFLHDILEGRRNLSPSSITRFAQGFRLSPKETDAFEALVLFSQAKNDDERNRYYQRLQQIKPGRPPSASFKADQFEVLANWYTFPIRELLLLPDFEEDPKWIAERLQPQISAQEAKKALALLERVGLIARNEDGVLEPADPDVATEAQIKSVAQALAARNFHRSVLENAARSLETLSPADRNLMSMTVKLSREQYEELCNRNMEYLQDILYEGSKSVRAPDPSDEVYVVGIQAIPVTRRKDHE